MPEPIFRNIRLLMPLCGPQVTSDRAPRLASLSTNDGENEGLFEAVEDVDAHPFGQDGALRDGAGPAVDGAGDSDAGTHHGAAFHSAVRQQFVEQADGGLDALLGVVAEGQQ